MPTDNVISVACSCGKRLKAPATAAGKKARCPACGAVLVLTPSERSSGAPPIPTAAAAKPKVPVAAAVATPSPRPAPPALGIGADEDDGLGALYELAEQAKTAPTAPDAAVCPQCRSAMDDQSVLCTNCGYDTRAGKSVTVARTPAPAKGSAPAKAGKKPAKVVDYMAPDGSLVLGIIFSAAFALVASVVWVAVAWLTGLTIGYIAILIGIAAGVGMQVGHRGYSKTGGYIASAMTIFAIMVAKFVVLEAILARHHSHASIFQLNQAKLGYYFFSPIGLIIIAVGVAAAYRTANGSSSN